jgi:cyclophilin family peptidyl-prolyl cis-trans isomerase
MAPNSIRHHRPGTRVRRGAWSAALILCVALLPMSAPASDTEAGDDVIAVLHTELGDITLRLFPESAPMAYENFTTHARNGYYDGVVFHRVIEDFMVQTGDPQGTGYGGRSIWGESFGNEIDPARAFDRPGVLAMANRGLENTNDSQFFLTLVPTPWLTGRYTIFGEVLEGMDVLEQLGDLDVNPTTDRPIRDVRVETITLREAGAGE